MRVFSLQPALLTLTSVCLLAPATQGEKIYWTHNDVGDHKIQRANLDGTQVEDFVLDITAEGLAVDMVNGKLYWTGDGNVAPSVGVFRINLDGTDPEGLVPLVSGSNKSPGIALDLAGGKMYWTEFHFADPGTGEIRRADLDGSNVETLLTGLSEPWGIALDVANGKMYWTDFRVFRADLEGSNVEELAPPPSTGSSGRGIALDLRRGKMYWGDRLEGLQRANLDGTDHEDLTETISAFGVALDSKNRKVYVAGGDLVRADLDGSDIELLLDDFQADADPGIALDLTEPIPAVSQWGLVALTLLTLTAGTILILRWPLAATKAAVGRPEELA